MIRELPKEVVKEVIKELPSAAEVAIFFKNGKAKISPEGMVNVPVSYTHLKFTPACKRCIALLCRIE